MTHEDLISKVLNINPAGIIYFKNERGIGTAMFESIDSHTTRYKEDLTQFGEHGLEIGMDISITYEGKKVIEVKPYHTETV